MSISKRINILHGAFHTESSAIFSLCRLGSKTGKKETAERKWFVQTELISTVPKRTYRHICGPHWSGQSSSLTQIINSYKKKHLLTDGETSEIQALLSHPSVWTTYAQSSPFLLSDAMNSEWQAVHHSRIFCSLTIQAWRIKHIIPGPCKCLKPHSQWIKRR